MTGPEHYAEAERLLTLADRHSKGVTYAQEWSPERATVFLAYSTNQRENK